jgi:O-antigen/teichoic acid export membrane protein
LVLLLALAFVRGHFAIGSRFLGLGPASLLVLATVVTQIGFSQSVYLRAHKREPFMWVSLGSGLMTALLVVALGRIYSAWGACLAYALVQIVIIIWATAVWKRCRRVWHQPVAATT